VASLSKVGVPFDSAQGRLSTALGWRLASLRMPNLENLLEESGRGWPKNTTGACRIGCGV